MSRPPARTAVGDAVVRRAAARFVALVVVGLLVVGLVSALAGASFSRDLAVRDATTAGDELARRVGGPLVDSGVRHGDAESLARFDRLMRAQLRTGGLRHVKVWDAQGHVLWSDEVDLIGRRFELEPKVVRLMSTGGSTGELSALDRPENAGERPEKVLVEVYAVTRDAEGAPVVVESYWPADRLGADAWPVFLRTAPIAVGALLGFALLVLPLALSLARRVQRVREHNLRLVVHSLETSDLERRRIAAELHDGVVQEVSGAGYALDAALLQIPPQSREARDLVAEVARLLRGIGTSLRGVLLDVHPDEVDRCGLEDSVEVLADRARRSGLEVVVDVAQVAGEERGALQLVHRVVREGLRNVVHHARATRVQVSASVAGDVVEVVVRDDGVGMPPDHRVGEGHLGLHLLRDALEDVGGELRIANARPGGVELRAHVPRLTADPWRREAPEEPRSRATT